jgi:stage II sporulation protein M
VYQAAFWSDYVSAKLRLDISKHIIQYKTFYLVVLFVYTTGISAGAFISASEASSQMRAFAGYLQTDLNMAALNPMEHTAILWISVLQNIQVSIAIWVLGLFYPGIPFILLIIGIKGFFSGFTVGFFIHHYGFEGLMLVIFSFLPQSLIYIPVLIAMAVVSLNFGINGYRERNNYGLRLNRYEAIKGYAKQILLLFALLLIPTLIETFVAPLLFIFSSSVWELDHPM